jgi:hypothetical protein
MKRVAFQLVGLLLGYVVHFFKVEATPLHVPDRNDGDSFRHEVGAVKLSGFPALSALGADAS